MNHEIIIQLRYRYLLWKELDVKDKDNIASVVELFTCKNKCVLDDLSIFIRKAMAMHQDYAENMLNLLNNLTLQAQPWRDPV